MKWTVCLPALFILSVFSFHPLRADDDPNFPFSDENQQSQWVPPPPTDASDRLVAFNLRAAFQHDADLQDQAFSMLDLSAERPLDENSVTADGLIRFRKSLSSSDVSDPVDLRLARISYLKPWIQLTLGRFDLFKVLTPGSFFGAYPVMGIHRVDGVMATIPFSFFFGFGPSQSGKSQASSPLALSFFYTPSLFSAQQVQYNLTQSFWLSQLRCRLEGTNFSSTLRVNFGGSASDYFNYSSVNGAYTGSVAADLSYRQYGLTAEYGIQNLDLPSGTGALALGFQASRLGTWGDFSLDQIALEGQFPLASSLLNPFTGGDGLDPGLAELPRNSWYLKIRARLKILFIEVHLTNNRNDFTFGRPSPGSLAVPFTGHFGPGNETDGPGTPLVASSYDTLACLVLAGVEF
jgi:hypothetical protein